MIHQVVWWITNDESIFYFIYPFFLEKTVFSVLIYMFFVHYRVFSLDTSGKIITWIISVCSTVCYMYFLLHIIDKNMAALPQEDGGGIFFFCLRAALLWRTLVRGGYMEGNVILVLRGTILGLIVSIHLKENLPVVNIN